MGRIVARHKVFNADACAKLEFKFDLHDLIFDFSGNEKQFSQIDLAVAWHSSFSETDTYSLESNLEQDQPYRKYFGTTHNFYNTENREHQIEVILLEDLLNFLKTC